MLPSNLFLTETLIKSRVSPMVFQRIISRFPGRSIISGQTQWLSCRNSNPSVKFSDQSLFQITQKRDLFSGSFENNGPVDTEKNTGFFEGSNRRLDDINRREPSFETGRNPGYFESLSRRILDNDRTRAPAEMGRDGRPFSRGFGSFESSRNSNFVRGIMRDNLNDNYRSGLEQNADVVHIKIMRNNTFVTVTDSKGNKKMGASAGCLAEMKGGPKVSKYSAEATAEHVGRVAKSMGLKSVVMKVNGFTFFKKKKLAILSFRDGYTNSRSDRNPIVYIEDTTRKPHNGCRLRKQRRV